MKRWKHIEYYYMCLIIMQIGVVWGFVSVLIEGFDFKKHGLALAVFIIITIITISAFTSLFLQKSKIKEVAKTSDFLKQALNKISCEYCGYTSREKWVVCPKCGKSRLR